MKSQLIATNDPIRYNLPHIYHFEQMTSKSDAFPIEERYTESRSSEYLDKSVWGKQLYPTNQDRQ
jgi:hypothetical protein